MGIALSNYTESGVFIFFFFLPLLQNTSFCALGATTLLLRACPKPFRTHFLLLTVRLVESTRLPERRQIKKGKRQEGVKITVPEEV